MSDARLEDWRFSLLLPGVIGALAVAVLHYSGFDALWANTLYGLEGGHWALRNYWLTSNVLHYDAQRLVIVVGVFTLLACVAGWLGCPGLRRVRSGLAYVLAAALTAVLLVALGKNLVPIPCPWDLARYGGDVTTPAVFMGIVPGFAHGGCFPAGHAGAGYCMLAWFFFARHYRLPGGAWWLLPGLGLGLVFGITQQLRGAHFISHDAASLTVCWLSAAGWYRATLGRCAARGARSGQPVVTTVSTTV